MRKKLKEFKESLDGTVINYGTKTSVLAVFSFRAALNLGMLLTERLYNMPLSRNSG